MHRYALIATATAALAASMAWHAAVAQRSEPLHPAIEAVADYSFGDSREKLTEVERMVQHSLDLPPARRSIARDLATLLQQRGATADAKAFALRQLALCAGDEQIELLAKLLNDKALGYLALNALSNVPGPRADAALIGALPRARNEVRIAVISALGMRGVQEAVDPLAELLRISEAGTAAAAASALGRIGGEEACKALWRLRNSIGSGVASSWAAAMLDCADSIREADPRKAGKYYEHLVQRGLPEGVRTAAFAGQLACDPRDAEGRALQALRGHDEALERGARAYFRERARYYQELADSGR